MSSVITWSEYISRRCRHEPTRYSLLYISGCAAGRISRQIEEPLARVSRGLIDWRSGSWHVVAQGRRSVSKSLAVVSARLAAAGLIPPLRGERYWIRGLADQTKLGAIDRSAAIFFGFRTQGVHLNVYTKARSGDLEMWLARRALTRLHFPGQLDNLVAGGLSAARSFREMLRREAEEEAGLDEATFSAARAAGRLYYCMDTHEGLVDGEMAVFDLEVSPLFRPQNGDGSVDRFLLVSLVEAEHLALIDDAFKFNCGLVLYDFLLRHGSIDARDGIPEAAVLLRRGEAWLGSGQLESAPGGGYRL